METKVVGLSGGFEILGKFDSESILLNNTWWEVTNVIRPFLFSKKHLIHKMVITCLPSCQIPISNIYGLWRTMWGTGNEFVMLLLNICKNNDSTTYDLL
jgi:hypothetical protein